MLHLRGECDRMARQNRMAALGAHTKLCFEGRPGTVDEAGERRGCEVVQR